MYKIKVLTLNGCSLCESLVEELREAGIKFVELNADLNSDLADKTEVLIGTINYPIVVLEIPEGTTYFFRADDTTQVGSTSLDQTTVKVGCVNISSMIQLINLLINK